MTKIRILLADDHGVVREGIKRLLEHQPEFAVVAECADGREAVERAAELRPDVILMDLSMPGISGIEATRQALKASPATRVVAVTVHQDESYVREVFRAGAKGYLLKRSAPDLIPRAILAVAAGETFIDPGVSPEARRAAERPRPTDSPLPELSDREVAVLRAIAEGYSNKEISAQLQLSVKTVETYKARGAEKLGLRSRVDIVRLAHERGWTSA